MTRSSLPIFLSSVPYTAVPYTLSLAIKETVSFGSRVVAVVIEVPFIASARHACAEIDRFGDKCGEWLEFRLALRNPISFDEQRCATVSIAPERLGPDARQLGLRCWCGTGGSKNVCSWHRTNLPASRRKKLSRGNVCQQFISAAQANKRDG
jgi:hypothetical protein